MESAAKHRLYFSTRCRFCQAFMEELVKMPFVREVTPICVDPSPGRPPLPAWLKSVPTLAVYGEDKPRVGPGEVNNWLFERKLGGGNSTKHANNRTVDLPMPSASTSAKLPAAISASTPADKGTGPPALAGNVLEGPDAYHETEMSGGNWSDSYSFLNHTEYSAEKGYDPISRNFEPLVNVDALGRKTTNGPGVAAPAQQKRSAKEDALLRDYEAYAANRDRDVGGSIRRM